MSAYVFGVDVGGTSAKIGLFTADGELIHKEEIPTGLNKSGEASLQDIADAITALLAGMHLTLSDLAGVGLDVPGPVLEDGSVSDFANLSWGAINVRDVLSGMLRGTRVAVGNDADVAALGELWKGAGQGYHSLVMVTLGTGVGGGIVLGDTILTGANGAAGEIGHMLVNPAEEDICGCGKRGCLEQYASATGLVRITKKHLAAGAGKSVLTPSDTLSAKDILDAAKEGDEAGRYGLHTMCRYLGYALANTASAVDPELFVIGGGVSKAGQILIDTIRPYYREAAFFAARDAHFCLARLGNDGGMYGAARMLL